MAYGLGLCQLVLGIEGGETKFLKLVVLRELGWVVCTVDCSELFSAAIVFVMAIISNLEIAFQISCFAIIFFIRNIFLTLL